MKALTGSKIFAVFNIVITSLAVLFTMTYGITQVNEYCCLRTCKSDPFFWILIIIAIIIVAIPFIMSVLLIVGIYKNKPKLTQCYVVFGMNLTGMAVFVTVSLLVNHPFFLFWHGLIVFGVCFLYLLILSMITVSTMQLEMEIQKNRTGKV